MSQERIPKTLRGRVRRFYQENPGEYLSYADMQAKFDCTYQQAATVVHALVGEGLLESISVIRVKEGQKA